MILIEFIINDGCNVNSDSLNAACPQVPLLQAAGLTSMKQSR